MGWSRRYTHAQQLERGGRLLQQVLRVFGGDSEVGAAKILERGEIYANHFSVAVEERSAGTAGCGGGVVDNFVLEHVADMALRGGGADKALGSELGHDVIDVPCVAGDFLGHVRTRPGENAVDSGWVANQHDGVSRHGGSGAIVEFEHRGAGGERRLELKSGD